MLIAMLNLESCSRSAEGFGVSVCLMCARIPVGILGRLQRDGVTETQT